MAAMAYTRDMFRYFLCLFLLSHGAESDQYRPDIGTGFRDQHSQGGDRVRKEDNGNIARKAQHHRSTVFVKAAVLAAMQKPTG